VLATSRLCSPNAVEGTNNANTEGLHAGHLTKAVRMWPLRVEDTTRHWKPHASSSRTESAPPGRGSASINSPTTLYLSRIEALCSPARRFDDDHGTTHSGRHNFRPSHAGS
jgi:hypothetical protein